jgi:methyl-accepting chemotaxis protein
MTTSTNTSVDMFGQMMNITTEEAKLKSDVMSLFDQATGYVAAEAVETQTALLPQIEQVKKDISEDISSLRSEFAALDNESATTKMDEIEAQYGRLVKFVDSSMERKDAGDQASAYTILFDKAEIQKVAIFHSTKVLDQAISDSSNNTIDAMNKLLIRGKVTSYIGIFVIIAVIIVSFLLSYINVVKKIRSIRSEVNGIIDGIESGNGDLTARINTKTKSELSYITSGINNFIETLQLIMKDVKDGSVVLASSSAEVSSQLHMVDDNVTNTSAALEELSASMETVSGNVNSINDSVDGVKSAAQQIADEATEGTKTANAIKAEADELKEQVFKKKSEASEQVERLS